MRRCAVFIIIASWFLPNSLNGQEISREISPDLQRLQPMPAMPTLPANIFLYNYKASLLPAGSKIFDAKEMPRLDHPFIPDMGAWQSAYYRNNFANMSLANPTLADGNVMGHAMKYQTEANMELYLNYMLMNQRAAGRTQLEMMNTRMRCIRHINVVGAGIGVTKLAVQYFTAPESISLK